MSDNFTTAFPRIAELAAISRITDFSESLQELTLQTIAVDRAANNQSASDVTATIFNTFGIQIEEHLVDTEIEVLIKLNKIERDLYGNYRLSPQEEEVRLSAIKKTQENEDLVFLEWKTQIDEKLDETVTFQAVKDALMQYLTCSFRNHGIETARLLDPSANLSLAENTSLNESLELALDLFPREHKQAVRELINCFFIDLKTNRKKRNLILDFADGAFSFFCFYIDPKVRQRLYEKLQKIEFFLDTNFLWGLLGLHQNQYVESSVHFFELSQENNLPFRFKYHRETEGELKRSIAGSAQSLHSKRWTKPVSLNLSKSPYISGVEKEYHRINASERIDVPAFLSRFDNIGLVVQDKGITLDNRDISWNDEINALFHEYKDYLESYDIERSEEAIQHDVRILVTLRKLRLPNPSPLRAGVLFLTCDKKLYYFDLRNSKQKGINPTTILPTVMLQIVRPLIRQTDDFDTLFANTFSMPEFRIHTRKSAKASEKIAELLAAHKGLPASVAEQLLIDQYLVRDVQNKKPEECEQIVESALAKKLDEISRKLIEQQKRMEERDRESLAVTERARKAEQASKEANQRLKALEIANGKSDGETKEILKDEKAKSQGLSTTIQTLNSRLTLVYCGGCWLITGVLLFLFMTYGSEEFKLSLKQCGLLFLSFGCFLSCWCFTKKTVAFFSLLTISAAFLAAFLTT